MMRSTGLGAALLLAACAASGPQVEGYRRAGTGIYSNAVFQPQRLAGQWVQIAEFAEAGSPACSAAGLTITPADAAHLGVQADLCLGGVVRSFAGQAVVSGPGRLQLQGADPGGIGAEWWVLWVDDGYRTLVLGTPSGGFGMILNRDANLPADRLRAAREILDWNGYDLGRLRMVGQR